MSSDQVLSLVQPNDDSSEEMDILLRGDAYECRKLARRTDLQPDIVIKLYPKFLQELMDSGLLRAMTHSNPQLVKELFLEQPQIISEIRIDEEWVKYFAELGTSMTIAIAMNPALPKAYWNYCINHYEVDVRRSIAMNPVIDIGSVATLSGDSDLMVRRLAEGQRRSRFPTDQTLYPLVESETPEASTVKKIEKSKVSKVFRDGNIQVTINPSYLLIAGLSIALVLAVRSPQLSVKSTADDSKASRIVEDTNYANAIEFANEASAKARTSPETKSDWAAIVKNWGKAIELLEKVPKDDPLYTKAQKKIRSYKVIRSVANGNMKRGK
jgi:hypothetical protein